jgi:hypothetical protein
MKRVFFAFVWFVVIYFVTCMIVGGIAGGIAGSKHPNDMATAQRAGGIAGAKAVEENRLIILLEAVLLTALGTVAGVLPGTKGSPSPVDPGIELVEIRRRS